MANAPLTLAMPVGASPFNFDVHVNSALPVAFTWALQAHDGTGWALIVSGDNYDPIKRLPYDSLAALKACAFDCFITIMNPGGATNAITVKVDVSDDTGVVASGSFGTSLSGATSDTHEQPFNVV